ncbi:MAG: GTPase Era [Christensenellales bacterium]
MIRIYGNYEDIIKNTIYKAADRLGFSVDDVDVEVSVVDEEEIKSLNAETRGIDKVTDVLSFQNLENVKLPLIASDYPEEINEEDGSIILGEILICEERAKSQAEEYGHGVEREIAFLTCHGMLHLLGFDHQDEEGEKEMNNLCEEILTGAGYTREKKTEKREFRSGFVAVMGKPNAGKSTLINTIVGEKVAIVSWKPQTTRNKIVGIYNEENYQIVFIDTPGLHKPKNHLGEYMMKTASTALDGVDCVIYVVEAEKGYDEKDKFNIVSYVNSGHKVIVVVNKVDHVTKEKVFGILTELNNLDKLTAVVPVSALRSRNIKPLKDEIKKLLTDTVKYYPDEQYTDRNMRFMAAEIIREKALRLLDKEVPYGIGVDIREYRVRESGIIDVNADIICEKPAHKPIILGKGGAMIKKIATYARQDLEEMTGSKIFLTLFVRVKDDWRGSDFIMRELGYDTSNPD